MLYGYRPKSGWTLFDYLGWVHKVYTDFIMVLVFVYKKQELKQWTAKVKLLQQTTLKNNYVCCWHKQPADNKPCNFYIKCKCISKSYEENGFLGISFWGCQNLIFLVGSFKTSETTPVVTGLHLSYNAVHSFQ